MRKFCLFIVFVAFTRLLYAQLPQASNSTKHKRIVNRERIQSLSGKSIDYYLNHSGIDTYTKKFYKGELAISDDKMFYGILDSVLTENLETRPFYFFVFNRVLDLSQETFADNIASDCFKFISKYPCDFFSYLNSSEIEFNVVKWNTYVGSQFSNRSDFDSFRRTIELRMKSSCNENQDLWKSFFSETRTCVTK